MALKNYYAILGVSQHETPERIRAAYRDAVRRTHPDHAGPHSTPAFQEIVEAHSVLSDPERRREYNEKLTSEQRAREAGATHRFAAEAQPETAFVHRRRPSGYPAYATPVEQLLRNVAGWRPGASQRPRRILVEVILTPEEAIRGGAVTIDIPLPEICSECGGTGFEFVFPCLTCGGQGYFSEMRTLQVPVPEVLSRGLTAHALLEGMRMGGVVVRIQMRVSNGRR